ncbi:MAG: hypothetical protein LIP02_09780 [Bacteroidales bacterium]|nr:hypothetical protein [Bacteroidales bacterium]
MLKVIAKDIRAFLAKEAEENNLEKHHLFSLENYSARWKKTLERMMWNLLRKQEKGENPIPAWLWS